MRSKRSSADGVTVASSIGSVVVTGIDNRVDFPLAVAGASVHFERVESAVFRHVIDGGLADAELVGNLFLGECLVFLRLHVERKQTFAGGIDCVNHKLMEVSEADSEENIGRVRVSSVRLKDFKETQFHMRGMNLKSYIAK